MTADLAPQDLDLHIAKAQLLFEFVGWQRVDAIRQDGNSVDVTLTHRSAPLFQSG
jgi:hypothetical protein